MQDKHTRIYRSKDLIVYWSSKDCVHAGNCWRGLPGVFRPKERPWILLEQASPEEIFQTIDTCPTEALRYELPEGSSVDRALADGPGALRKEEPEKPMLSIKMLKNGQLVVEGEVQILSPENEIIRKGEKCVLCGCGKSKNKPFCDGAHLS